MTKLTKDMTVPCDNGLLNIRVGAIIMKNDKILMVGNNKRAEYLKPFTLTTILREQMLNLIEENEGVNIILKQSSKSIKKDKFSAFEYGLYYIKQEEDRSKRHKKRNTSEMMFFTS